MRTLLLQLFNIIILLYARTWRIRYHSSGSYETNKANGRNMIHPVWHNQLLPLCYNWRGNNIAALASNSKDGDIVTFILRKWGFVLARGSSSRGGVKALVSLKKLISQGRDCAVTVDGPRGPRYEVKPGVILLAKISGSPVVPVFFRTKHYKQFNSWDKFILPYPFARIDIYTTQEFFFDDDTSEEAVKRDIQVLTRIMRERFNEIAPDFI